MLKFTEKEKKIIRKLNTPAKIQDFLNKIPANFEDDGKGESCLSPVLVLRKNKCHCIEGALFAAACFKLNNIFPPLIIDMKTTRDDFEHVIAVFKIDGKWGAISKTNHAVLRYREPVYRDIRELVMSYFHEYTDSKNKGKKTLRSFSAPVNLDRFGNEWIFSEENLWQVNDYLDKVKHFKILTKKQERNLRKADKIEIDAGKLVEWKRRN